jgi:Tfp pilus assembly protein PilF
MAVDSTLQRHLDFAEGYLGLKMYADALTETEQALALDPKNINALYTRGVIHLEQKQLEQAEEAFQRLLALDPEQPHVFVHLAWIHRRTISLDKAIETIRQALLLKPKMPVALYNLACYHAMKGETEEALKLLAEAISLAQEYAALARTDPDFDSIRGLEAFQKLIEA